MSRKVELSDQEWRERLTPEQFAVLRQQATERAFTGAYWDTKEPGVYRCAGCGTELFRSDTKYDSGSGWPSFTEPTALDAVEVRVDTSHGMVREEVVCATCGACAASAIAGTAAEATAACFTKSRRVINIWISHSHGS